MNHIGGIDKKMLESIFILLIVMAVLFLLVTIEWQSLMFGVVDIMLWLVLSLSIYNIEIPYQYITGSDIIGESVHIIQSQYIFSALFMGMAILTMLYVLIDIIFPMLSGKFSRMM